MQKLLLLPALAAGIFIAYIDSHPGWDDTAVTAFSLLLVSGLLGLLSPRRPWLWALAVGAWLPLWYIYKDHNLTMLVVLIFPFLGAYAGMLVRRMGEKVLHST